MTGQTNETGDFKLTLPDGTAGKIAVRVSAPSFKESRQVVDLAEDDEPYVVVEFAGSLSLKGRVTRSGSDKPIAGAEVVYQTPAGRRVAKTDADGRYKFDDLQPGGAMLTIQVDGFGQEMARVDPASTETYDVELRPEYRVDVLVVDDRDKPVAGVTIEAYSDEPRRTYSGITDKAGRAQLRGVHPDTPELHARLVSDAHITPRGWDRSIALPSGKDQVSQRFVLERPATLLGKVVRARDGEPVGLARISVGEDKRSFLISTNTNRSGEFKIIGLPAREVVVTADHAEYAPDLKKVRLAPGETARVELSLAPGSSIRGIVRDESERPAAGADVLTAEWRGYATLGRDTQTDSKGQFVLEHMPADGVKLLVLAKGFRPLTTELLKPGRKPNVITLSGPANEPPPAPMAGVVAGAAAPIDALGRAKTLNGQVLSAEEIKGKFLLLDFWATWCGPCVAEIPNVKAAAKALSERKDFLIIGVSLDSDEIALRKFVKDKAITWSQLFGEPGRVPTLTAAFGVRAIPSTFLISPDGKILASGLRGESLAERITQYLEGKVKPPTPRPVKPVTPDF